MSAPRHVWQRLGITPTSDVSAIRRAYAVALKALDVDADPAGFEQLRAAREAALAHARAAADDAAPTEPVTTPGIEVVIPLGDQLCVQIDALADATPGDITTAIGDVDATYRRPVEPIPDDAIERSVPPVGLTAADLLPPLLHSESQATPLGIDRPDTAILNLLFATDAEDRFVLRPDHDAVLLRQVEAMLADPRMEEIAFYASVERWLSEVLADAIPRSDAALARVAEHFGWLADKGRIDQPPAIAAVVQRYESLRFYDEVQRPRHEYHRAWRELTKPAGESSRRTFGVSGKSVRKLLATVRRDHPDLEGAFDWYRVGLWERPSTASFFGSWQFWAFGAWILLMLVRIGGEGTAPNSNSPVPVAQYETPQVLEPERATRDDITQALFRVTDGLLSPDRLKAKQPKLYAMLETNWILARENKQTRDFFIEETVRLLAKRVDVGKQRANNELVATYQRLRLDIARSRGSSLTAQCAVNGNAGLDDPGESLVLRRRQRELVARILTETDGNPPRVPISRNFAMPGSLVDAAASRAALKREDFVAAMQDKGTPATRCRAEIATIEEALKLPPKQALPILRAL